jgi:nucleotide-binding universal stress UspA family protein
LNGVLSKVDYGVTKVEAKILSGRVADSIVDFASKNNVDIIIIATHGRSGVSRWVYGSVADRVLYHASCPTAVIHPQVETDPFTHKRIMVPLDGSLLAERALKPALKLAQAVSAELVLLRVTFMPLIPPGPIPGWPGTEVVMNEDELEAKAYLQRVRESLSDSPIQLRVHITASSVAESIIDMADELQVDLIVMSSHGRSGIGRWVFGSETEKTLRGAHCTTLVIR